MITPKLYVTLHKEERRLWHSHEFEVRQSCLSATYQNSPVVGRLLIDKKQVRSGMLIMLNPNVPNAIWETAETEEMKEVTRLYGKTYHFWQVDRGDKLPLGRPELMMSFTKDEQVNDSSPNPSQEARREHGRENLMGAGIMGRRSRIEMRDMGLTRIGRRKLGRKLRVLRFTRMRMDGGREWR
jgi:hypothetical protein